MEEVRVLRNKALDNRPRVRPKVIKASTNNILKAAAVLD